MRSSPGADATLDRFRDIIGAQFGLFFDESRMGMLSDALAERIRVVGPGAEPYLDRLAENRCAAGEWGALAELLTVTETCFFRNAEQFAALTEFALPDRLAGRPARPLRLLSAGCASGEEPYSLAIVLREHASEAAVTATIDAIDVNPAMLRRARAATYSRWALRNTDADRRNRWFTPKDTRFVLDSRIRDAVAFSERNLTHDDAEFWWAKQYDIVFCRNVLMYFSEDSARAVVRRLAHSIAPGGFLFLGHAETLRGLSEDFDLVHTHETFYYRRQASTRGASVAVPSPWEAHAAAWDTVTDGAEWIEAVRDASDRIESLSRAGDAAAATTLAPVPQAQTPFDLTGVRSLIRGELFGEAIDKLERLRPREEQGADVLLLKAVAYVQTGNIATAEEMCRALLALEERHAGAHYLLALCCERNGDLARAAEHDREAATCDPAFSMPRLHLGLLARRGGATGEARREFTAALMLLQRDDDERLALFGGGFGREALIALCRSALSAEAES